MEGYFEHIAEHIAKLTSCTEYSNFIYEYNFVSNMLKEAISIEKAFIIESGMPSELLENLESKKALLINDLIETHYEMTKEKILSLKTEKAKINNANKFIDNFKIYFEEFPTECTSNTQHLYDELIKLCTPMTK